MVEMRFPRTVVWYRMTFYETIIIVRKGIMVDINTGMLTVKMNKRCGCDWNFGHFNIIRQKYSQCFGD